jgi:hypothetical protein
MTADTHPQVDEAAFSELAERYRPEMRVHCYRPMALDVILVEAGRVAEIVTFPPEVFPAFALPDEL